MASAKPRFSVTHGPDTALVLRNTMRDSIRDGVLTAVGASTGLLVWGLASALGSTIVMASSATLFEVTHIIGGVYLLWLGSRTLWNAWRANPDQHIDGVTPTHEHTPRPS